MKQVSRDELAKIIRSGKYVTITALKSDGTVRVLNGRAKVKKYLKGGKRTTDPAKCVNVHEVGDKPGEERYRSFRIDRLISVKSGGELYIPAEPLNVEIN
jgi:hypothetical protein